MDRRPRQSRPGRSVRRRQKLAGLRHRTESLSRQSLRPCMSELPAETRPARLRVEAASPASARGSKCSGDRAWCGFSTTAVPHPGQLARALSPHFCKVGLWTNNAPSSSASTYLKIALDVHLADRQARHSKVPRELAGDGRLGHPPWDRLSPLLYPEATGGLAGCCGVALAGVGLPLCVPLTRAADLGDFARAMGRLAKTDTLRIAEVIALFAERVRPQARPLREPGEGPPRRTRRSAATRSSR